MENVFCKTCSKDMLPDENGNCPECKNPLQSGASNPDTESKSVVKSLNLSYAKSIAVGLSDDELIKTLAVKFVSPDTIFHYSFLWGDSTKTDLEREFFTKSTDMWDGILGASRPLTWDHGQDAGMKADPVIGKTFEWGNDETGRWALSRLDRAHKYRKAIDALIEEGVIGTSSDSASQYVIREPVGKSTFIKTWPWFASALTDQPCEPRMTSSISYLKSIGSLVPDPAASDEQVRNMVQKARRLFESFKMYGE
jgi:hypothetical protein